MVLFAGLFQTGVFLDAETQGKMEHEPWFGHEGDGTFIVRDGFAEFLTRRVEPPRNSGMVGSDGSSSCTLNQTAAWLNWPSRPRVTPQVGMGLGEAGGEANRLVVGGLGLGVTPEHTQCVAEVVMEARKIRLEPDGLFAMREQPRAVGRRRVTTGPGCSSGRVAGFNPDSLAEMRERLIDASNSRAALPRLVWAAASRP